MFKLKTINLILLIIICGKLWGDAKEIPALFGDIKAEPHVPVAPPVIPKCNVTSSKAKKSFGLEFRLPFLDIKIENNRNLLITQENENQDLFVLHGNEFYQLFVTGEEKRLALIGVFGGNIEDLEPLDFQVTFWRGYLIIVVALEEYLEVYQISANIVSQRTKKESSLQQEKVFHLEPIQQLMILGKYKKFHMVKPAADKLMLIVVMNFTKLYGKYRNFEWALSYFELIEELTVPQIHIFNVIGTFPKYIISGRFIRNRSKIIVTVSEITTSTLKLKSIQTLTLSSNSMYSYTFGEKNYLVECSNSLKKCSIFRMSEGQFAVYKHRSSKELVFEHFKASKKFLVGIRRNEAMVFTNRRLDCFGSITFNDSSVSSILTHINHKNESYIILNYKRQNHMLIRIVEVDVGDEAILGGSLSGDAEEIGTRRHHQHMFEETVGRLRSLLLKRKVAMDVFRKIDAYITPNLQNITVNSDVRIERGKIDTIKMEDESVLSPTQILKRLSDLRQAYGIGRTKRSLSLTENKTIEGPISVKQLNVDNLIYDGEIIKGFSLDKTTKPLPTLTIRQNVTTKMLRTNELITPGSNRTEVRPQPIETLKTHHLIVKSINNVSWTDLMDQLFLKDRDTEVKGNLTFNGDVTINHLKTKRINNLSVEKMFNLKEPQVISSNISFSNVFVQDLQAEKINGLDFSNDVVYRGENVTITSPVEFRRINVTGDIILGNSTKFQNECNTHNYPLRRYHTGKVVINGSLTVNKLLKEDKEKTTFIVDGQPFSNDILEKTYLLNDVDQVFEEPIVFGNAKVTVPELKTEYLNDHPIHQHLMTNSSINDGIPLRLIFMSAVVKGDVICKDYESKLRQIDRNSVKRGEVANITGNKIFEAPVIINDLMTLQLNELPVEDLVTTTDLENEDLNITGMKYFKDIIVEKESVFKNQPHIAKINGIDINEALNISYEMEELKLNHTPQVFNLVVEHLNGYPIGEFFAKFELRNGEWVLHKNLIIDGDAVFSQNLEVQSINGINWNEYEQSLVRSNENAIIEGHKRFLKKVTIMKQLNTTTVNDIILEEVFKNFLSRSKPQVVTGTYTFENVQFANVDVSRINDVNTSDFIDTRDERVIINSDVVIPKLTVHGNLFGNFVNSFNFSRALERIQELPNKKWKNIMVLGNAYTNVTLAKEKTQMARLEYLYKNAVRRNGNQTITGNVKLKSPTIKKLNTKAPFPGDIDLDFIIKDALVEDSIEEQVVYGEKTFLGTVRMRNVSANSLFHMSNLNNINLAKFNETLYSGETICGPVYFEYPPTIENLYVSGTINGIKPENIYFLSSGMPVPPIKIRHLDIDSTLHIGEINDMNFNYFLKNRVKLHGEATEVFGHLTFENLVVNKELLVKSINGIAIDNIVLTKSDQLQEITGTKFIKGNLVLAGPTYVDRLNDRQVFNSYENTGLVTIYDLTRTMKEDELVFNAETAIEEKDIVDNITKKLDSSNQKTEGNDTQLIGIDVGYKTILKSDAVVNDTSNKMEDKMKHAEPSVGNKTVNVTQKKVKDFSNHSSYAEMEAENPIMLTIDSVTEDIKLYNKTKAKFPTLVTNSNTAIEYAEAVKDIDGMYIQSAEKKEERNNNEDIDRKVLNSSAAEFHKYSMDYIEATTLTDMDYDDVTEESSSDLNLKVSESTPGTNNININPKDSTVVTTQIPPKFKDNNFATTESSDIQEDVSRSPAQHIDSLRAVDEQKNFKPITEKTIEYFERKIVTPSKQADETTEKSLEMVNSVSNSDMMQLEAVSDTHKNVVNSVYLNVAADTTVLWEKPKETINLSLVYETRNSTICNRTVFNVQTSADNKRIYIQNQISNYFAVNIENDIILEAENFCYLKKSNVKSKISITGASLKNVMGMKKFVKNIKLFDFQKGKENFLILLIHAVNLENNKNEVRILRTQNSKLINWQTITQGVGSIVRFMQAGNHTFIFTNGVIDGSCALSIYKLELTKEKFVNMQMIAGKFDIIELISSPTGRHMLVLSCQRCQLINSYELLTDVDSSTLFKALPCIGMQQQIKDLYAFAIWHDSTYLLVLSEQGVCYLYTFLPKQVWSQESYNNFGPMEVIVPLLKNKTAVKVNEPFLLLCNTAKCRVVELALR